MGFILMESMDTLVWAVIRLFKNIFSSLFCKFCAKSVRSGPVRFGPWRYYSQAVAATNKCKKNEPCCYYIQQNNSNGAITTKQSSTMVSAYLAFWFVACYIPIRWMKVLRNTFSLFCCRIWRHWSFYSFYFLVVFVIFQSLWIVYCELC